MKAIYLNLLNWDNDSLFLYQVNDLLVLNHMPRSYVLVHVAVQVLLLGKSIETLSVDAVVLFWRADIAIDCVCHKFCPELATTCILFSPKTTHPNR